MKGNTMTDNTQNNEKIPINYEKKMRDIMTTY